MDSCGDPLEDREGSSLVSSSSSSCSSAKAVTFEEAWTDMMDQCRNLDKLLGSFRFHQVERRKSLLECSRVFCTSINATEVGRSVAQDVSSPLSTVEEPAAGDLPSSDGSPLSSSSRSSPSNHASTGVWHGKSDLGLVGLGGESDSISSALDAFAEGKLRVPGGLSMTRNLRGDPLNRSSSEATGDLDSSSDSDDSSLDMDRDEELTRKLLELEADDQEDPRRWSLLSQASGLTLDIIHESKKEDEEASSDSSTDDAPLFSSCRNGIDLKHDDRGNGAFHAGRERYNVDSIDIGLDHEPGGSAEEICLSD